MTTPPFELREAKDGTLQFRGYAATFSRYQVGPYHETLKAGCFTESLAANPSVPLLINHDGLPLAHTDSGTLKLSQDDTGLHVEAKLDPSDPDVQLIAPKMRRGDLREMSFAFRVRGEHDQEWNAARTERSIFRCDLDHGDVSIVTAGANAATSATLRADLGLDERRRLADRIGFEVRGSTGLLVPEGRAANQFGAHQPCDACSGSGDCADCGGTGQIWESNDEQNSAARKGRPASSRRPFDDEIRRRAGLPVPPTTTSLDRDAAEIRLRAAKLK